MHDGFRSRTNRADPRRQWGVADRGLIRATRGVCTWLLVASGGGCEIQTWPRGRAAASRDAFRAAIMPVSGVAGGGPTGLVPVGSSTDPPWRRRGDAMGRMMRGAAPPPDSRPPWAAAAARLARGAAAGPPRPGPCGQPAAAGSRAAPGAPTRRSFEAHPPWRRRPDRTTHRTAEPSATASEGCGTPGAHPDPTRRSGGCGPGR